MARVSRKPINQKEEQVIEKATVFNTALYVRLSVEDSGKKDKDSIETQKSLLMQYMADQSELKMHKIYCDNGRTGTNFERPAFQELMDDIRKGKVNCIVVKDLSRFGRNFAETGQYIEQIFPFLGVRFISVNDRFDSFDDSSKAGLMVALKNLVNAAYSRDLSKKVRSQKSVQRKKGVYIGSFAPYGYMKDPDKKGHLVIDEETAPVIRKIFEWRATGDSYKTIAGKLNEAKIPSPMKHMYRKGIVKKEKFNKTIWTSNVVYPLLSKKVYLGHMEQGKTKVTSCGSKTFQKVPEEQWVIVENTHESIISEELFYEVQQYNAENKVAQHPQGTKHWPDKILKGLMTCGHCGSNLIVIRQSSQNRDKVSYRVECKTRSISGKTACVPNSITEKAVLKAVASVLKKHMEVAIELDSFLEQLKASSQFAQQITEREVLKRSLTKDLLKVSTYRMSLYQDLKQGLLSQEDYEEFIKEYDVKKKRLKKEQKAIESEEKQAASVKTITSKWMDKFEAFKEEEKITREMAEIFIDNIVLYQGKRMEIHLKCEDEFRQVKQYINQQLEISEGGNNDVK